MGCGSSAPVASTTENREDHKKEIVQNEKITARIPYSVNNEVEPNNAKVCERYAV